MAAPRVDRRLPAIMALDVVGYSRLIGADEAGTLARVKAHRIELAEPLIAEHHGRVVKLTGDGALVEFASAVDAVECAVAIQNGMAEREAAEPEDRRIRYRIGINIGDIVLEDGDIFGDGVNVAARLEGTSQARRHLGSAERLRSSKGEAQPRLRTDGRAPGQEHRRADHRLSRAAQPGREATETRGNRVGIAWISADGDRTGSGGVTRGCRVGSVVRVLAARPGSASDRRRDRKEWCDTS
jgi:class 3 adenylate cyclase